MSSKPLLKQEDSQLAVRPAQSDASTPPVTLTLSGRVLQRLSMWRKMVELRWWTAGLVAVVLLDAAATFTVTKHGLGRAQLALFVLRVLALLGGFWMAAHIRREAPARRPSMPEAAALVTEGQKGDMDERIDRYRSSAQHVEKSTGKKDLTLIVMFVVVTVESMFTGVQVLVQLNITGVDAACLTIAVVCMNAEYALFKGLMDELTSEEGVIIKGLHEHTLHFSKDLGWVWCKICRERLGPRTGGNEGFYCKECKDESGTAAGAGFQICLGCYRKQQSKTNTQEGILRGDLGPKYIEPLTTWQYTLRAIELLSGFKYVLYFGLCCVCFAQFARVLMPFYQGQIINMLIKDDADDFSKSLTIFIGLSLAAMILGSGQSLAVEVVQRRMTVDMRTAMFASLLKQDIAFYDGLTTGQVTSRMNNDIGAVVSPVRQLMNTVLTNVLRLAGGGFMCFLTSWKLTVLASTLIGPVIYLTRVYAVWSRKINMLIRVHMADGNSVAIEALRNIRTVRSFGADQSEFADFSKHMRGALSNSMKDAYASAGLSAATNYLEFAATVLILWFGGKAVLDPDEQLTIGQLVTFQLYWNMLNSAISALNGVLTTLIRAASAAQRVFEVIDLEPDIHLDGGSRELASNTAFTMEFRDVRFAYQMRPDKQVLKGITFTIPAGSTVAVVGRSGAGKSTLVSMLLRWYDPQGGKLIMNGEDLKEHSLRQYMKRVSLVSQDTQLFCRPVRDNLTYGLPYAVSDDDVVTAAKKANADEFIQGLDEGYSSMVGEGGLRLSGGQKQRLAIARALVRKPSLLLLDEATSALDAENEGKVQVALDELMKEMAGRCSIMLIAHRLSTVMSADKIVVIDDGAVVEEGTHDQLLENDHIYAQLVKRQLAKQANLLPEDAAAPAPDDSGKKGKGKGR